VDADAAQETAKALWAKRLAWSLALAALFAVVLLALR
jgi:hypothetical protein